MNDNVIHDLNNYPFSDRHGSYGGMAGSKDGLLIDGECWIVKYPQNTKDMRPPIPSYTSAPLSEFIGSHIYKILGYDVHETFLGFRNDKIVVACKDFCKSVGDLREIRTLKNAYNKELEEKLNTTFPGSSHARFVDLDELFIHLSYNPILSDVAGLKDRFWDCVIVDGFINNNDRNNGNWGLLYEGQTLKLAPIFDNGSSFSNKHTDKKIFDIMSREEQMLASSLNIMTVYAKDNKQLSFQELIEIGLQFPEFVCALKRNVTLLNSKMNDIVAFIEHIPDEYKGINVCSQIRKDFYTKGMLMRLEHILIPALEKARSVTPSLSDVIHSCECKRETCIHKKDASKIIEIPER